MKIKQKKHKLSFKINYSIIPNYNGITFTTFYSPDLKRSADRFKNQATKMGLYDSIELFTFEDLNDDLNYMLKNY